MPARGEICEQMAKNAPRALGTSPPAPSPLQESHAPASADSRRMKAGPTARSRRIILWNPLLRPRPRNGESGAGGVRDSAADGAFVAISAPISP